MTSERIQERKAESLPIILEMNKMSSNDLLNLAGAITKAVYMVVSGEYQIKNPSKGDNVELLSLIWMFYTEEERDYEKKPTFEQLLWRAGRTKNKKSLPMRQH